MSEQTQAFLSTHLIAPTPVNYSVIYLYFTQKNDKLIEVIEDKIASDELFSSAFMDNLFSRFVSYSHHLEKTFIDPFEEVLTGALDKIFEQVNNEKKVGDNLKKLQLLLSDEENSMKPAAIAKFMINITESANIAHQTLSNDLSYVQSKMKQLKLTLQSSRQEALVDALTGLLNQRGCEEKLKDLNIDDVHSSLSIDIDNFKSINEQFGHLIGDKVIQRVAKTIKQHIGHQDLAIRFGGEEFIVVMANKNIDAANITAENIRLAITKMRLIQRESNTYLPAISVSIGIAENSNVMNWTSLFEQADNALYQAKNAGKNCCISS